MSNFIYEIMVSRFCKTKLNRDSFELIEFDVEPGKVSFSIDGEENKGELTEKDQQQLLKMIPIKGFHTAKGKMTMKGLICVVTTIEKGQEFTKEIKI